MYVPACVRACVRVREEREGERERERERESGKGDGTRELREIKGVPRPALFSGRGAVAVVFLDVEVLFVDLIGRWFQQTRPDETRPDETRLD